MSRAFTPPDTLTPTDIKTVADVRRSVWINGLFGLGVGSVTGMVGHLVLQTLQRRYVPEVVEKSTEALSKSSATSTASTKSLLYKVLKPLPPLTKNTFLLSFLGGGALGSFLLSTTAGKNAVHLLHPIFQIGREEYVGLSPYQIEAKKAAAERKKNQLSNATSTTTITAAAAEDDDLDIHHHKARTQNRKSTLKQRLESGPSLSDTHSTNAHYQDEEDEEDEELLQRRQSRAVHRWERRQTERRKWVREKIESGGSLSDSHFTGSSDRS